MAGLRTRPICSQAMMPTYTPNQSAWRMTTRFEAGGFDEKRRLRKATSGKSVPVIAKIRAKKNSHRVPPLGEVYCTIAYKPPQPRTINMAAVGR